MFEKCQLFRHNVDISQEFTGLSSEASNRLAERFVRLGFLHPKEKGKKYGRIFVYKEYLRLFEK